MDKVSFYDLDYIIQLNEKRLEQYSDAYQKNIDKFTNILIIYSALAVFLVPIIQSLFFSGKKNLFNYIFFFSFLLSFIYSVFYTIRLLIPIEVAYLIEPKAYYQQYRLEYEKSGKDENETDKYVKASYINELEKAVSTNNAVFKRKGEFNYQALVSGLIACILYIFCIAFYFSTKVDDIQKVDIINMDKISNFDKISSMAADTGKTNTSITTKTTQLPGIIAADVIQSNPQMLKENFRTDSSKKNSSTNKKEKK